MTPRNLILENAEPGIRIVRLSRPKALNALNTETLHELRDALRAIASDRAVRALILTGEGEKAFIAGADIAEMRHQDPRASLEFARLGQDVTKLLELMSKPTIAAVNGFALGGGTEMAISCDFILASEKAVFGQPEVGLGVIPGFGGTVRLAKFVGWPLAKELIFTGRHVKAEEALRIGLVNHVFPAERLIPEAIELARKISAHSAGAVAAAKSLMNAFSESTGLETKLEAEAREFSSLFGTPDQREGMGAFTEKRKPAFEGLEKS